MTDELPDYTSVEPPDDMPVVEYTHHERRAEILQLLVKAGAPGAIKQARLAERYDVAESTISRDMDRLRASIDAHLGRDAKKMTRILRDKTIQELQAEGKWKQAWDVMMEWNEWLADVGAQDREPDRAEVDVDVDSRHAEVAYTIVREEPDLPTDDAGGVDYETLGFTQAPETVGVTAVDDVEIDDE